MANNFFRKPVPDLKTGTEYSFKFRWKYTDGTYSAWSVAKNVLTAGSSKIESPTKATGLSAKTAPFGLLVLWDGTYANDDRFIGFKSINIYASKTDLGLKTTNNISADLVGSMTVDAVKNSVTIGLENLRDTLDLVGEAVYNQDVFLYYISLNENDESYQENGQNTYYRINSDALKPTKANYIDLASGVISIENLVAGNGQFTSWLRAGLYGSSPGGSRIELSGLTSPFTATSGGTVVPGLTVYDSSGAKAFRADLLGNVTFSGVLKSTTQENFTPLVSTHNAYIEIPKSEPKILFYPKSTNGEINAGQYGAIYVTEQALGPGINSDVANIVITPPTYKTDGSASDASIEIYEDNTQDTGIWLNANEIKLFANTQIELVAEGPIYISPGNGAGAYIQRSQPTSDPFIRNIKATSSGVPQHNQSASQFNYGDIWFEHR
jgi:hypothetical protein